jgi:diacylglycerol kinase family enzyme
VTAQAGRLPRGLPGLYALATVLALPRMRRHKAWLTTEDEAMQARLLNVNLANLRYFGGGMTAAPQADGGDGMLDLVSMECGPFEVIKSLPRLFTGDFAIPGVTQRRFSWVRVDCEVPLLIQVDGELMGTTPAECRVAPNALDVVC